MSMTQDTAVTEYEIPSSRVAMLQPLLDKANKVARKLGCPEITLRVTGERLQKDNLSGMVRRYAKVEIVGSSPVIAGYTFVACIEHTDGGNIISRAPGSESVEVSAKLRDGDATCDHCKVRRNRKDTFLLCDADGAFIRVGRTCLKDFTRSEHVLSVLQLWRLLDQLREAASEASDCDEGWGVSGSSDYATEQVVAAAFRSIELFGWQGKSNCPDETTPTADMVIEACGRMPKKRSEIDEWKKTQPTEANYEDARAAIAWVAESTGTSDYEHNLRVACSLDATSRRNVGIVVSLAPAYMRHMRREVAERMVNERGEKVAISPDSQHFGEAGQRYVRKLHVVSHRELQGDYGLTVIYTMCDDDGNAFTWFSSGYCLRDDSLPYDDVDRWLGTGDTVELLFGVKKHQRNRYNDWLETIITRGKVLTEDCKRPKWLDSSGQVYKTRKAMKLAA